MSETEKQMMERLRKEEAAHIIVPPPTGMKFITKDEMYSWSDEYTQDRRFAKAQIPGELHQKLQDAIQHYRNVCKQIYVYLKEHPDDEFKI